MSSWKPSCIKNNEKFKNIPNKMEYGWNKGKKDSIIGRKKQYKLDDANFPTLGTSKVEKKVEKKVEWKVDKKVEHKVSERVDKKVEWKVEKNVEKKVEWKVDKKVKIKVESGLVWLNTKDDENGDIVERTDKVQEWTEEDSIDEYFDVLHTDTILDIHDSILSYCNEKNLPYYDSYDKFYNLVHLVKDNSTVYSNMFKEDEDVENNENEEEIIDEEII